MEQHNVEIGTQKDLILYRLETAKTNLNSAKILFESEDFKGANNRTYYAVFHAINAIHALNGKSFKRHKDAIANFNKEYVKNGIFSRDIGRKIGEIEDIRHASDYDDFYVADKKETERQIKVAEEFIDMADKYCNEKMD